MRKLFLLFMVIGLTQVSCQKTDLVDQIRTSLDGQWRMIQVTDNTSGFRITKPSSVQGDVDISFTSTNATDGTFHGNTPTNIMDKNNYSIRRNHSLIILNLGMTKAGETSWGSEFVDNIRSAQEYSYNRDGKLNIKTAKNILTFLKL